MSEKPSLPPEYRELIRSFVWRCALPPAIIATILAGWFGYSIKQTGQQEAFIRSTEQQQETFIKSSDQIIPLLAGIRAAEQAAADARDNAQHTAILAQQALGQVLESTAKLKEAANVGLAPTNMDAIVTKLAYVLTNSPDFAAKVAGTQTQFTWDESIKAGTMTAGETLMCFGYVDQTKPDLSHRDFNVAFPKPFESAPTVVDSIWPESEANSRYYYGPCDYEVSATGFTVRTWTGGKNGTTLPVRYNWLAIGRAKR
jgi:hypothetical protein